MENWILLHDKISPETAHTNDDYPYGSLRTSIRWWIETATKGKGRGQQRIMQQTLNPKTAQWNKPHASVYADMQVLYIDQENGHCHNYPVSAMSPSYVVRFCATGLYHQMNEEERKRFKIVTVLCFTYNGDSFRMYRWLLPLIRENPTKSAKEIIELCMAGIAGQDPAKAPYESDVQELLNMVATEQKLGLVDLLPRTKAEAAANKTPLEA